MFKIMLRFTQALGIFIVILVFIGFGFWVIKNSIASKKHHLPKEKIIPREEVQIEIPAKLNPELGKETGFIYEAFLSPFQEGGEEEDTPSFVPEVFHSTLPSVPRKDRKSKGHSLIYFTKDLSKAIVYLSIKNVDVANMNMLHLHCGRPGQLGPILVDFSLIGNINEYLKDDVLQLEITNEDIVATANQGEGLVSMFTSGCPIFPALPTDKVKTIAGMEYIARQGDLYFNLHTKAQTFYGDIRGQFYLTTSK